MADLTVVGVLLAAGRSSRFGPESKLLATLEGEPLVRRAANSLENADLDEIVAVIDPGADAVRSVLSSTGLQIVTNTEPGAPQSASVRTGVAWARGRADAVVFALGDMPCVSSRSVDHVVDAFRAGSGTALAAGYEGQRGNPVLFGARHFTALANLEGDRGGRAVLVDAPHGAIVETGDPGTRVDIDYPEDLEALRDQCEGELS